MRHPEPGLLDSTRRREVERLSEPDFLAGAGGNWPRQNEIDDPDVEPQLTEDSCGPACARIALRRTGAATVPSHEDLYERTGRSACNVVALARAMNESGGSPIEWTGGAVSNAADDFRALTISLARYTPWIAHLRTAGTRVGHLVVIIEVGSVDVTILDPWHPGTRYLMTLDDFADFWSLELVWRPEAA